jgi:glycosyltransferase involved in cell wall biosynthesis
VAFVLKGYPRLSETFIAQEIRGLERRGVKIAIISLRRPTDGAVHPVHREIEAPVTYLPEYLWHAPLRVWRGWRAARRMRGYAAAWRCWLRDLRRDPTPNRIRRFGQAAVLARELPPETVQLHAHFLHTPASVARYAAIMTGRPWTCSAHAKDIWTIPEWEKREKLADCEWVVTCTRMGQAHLGSLAPSPDKVRLSYHGLDPLRFTRPQTRPAERTGADLRDPVRLLSVGRAVEKKGFDVLIDALAQLPPGLNWRLTHIGGGPLRERLKRQAKQRGVADRIEWLGAQPQERVIAAYRDADIFVLANRVASDGDRDGLPNVLMEAMSQELACIASATAAVPELIADGATGLLVPSDESGRLADAIVRLAGDPGLRMALGRAGAETVRVKFSFATAITELRRLFPPDRPRAAPIEIREAVCASPSTHP